MHSKNLCCLVNARYWCGNCSKIFCLDHRIELGKGYYEHEQILCNSCHDGYIRAPSTVNVKGKQVAMSIRYWDRSLWKTPSEYDAGTT